MSAMFFGRGKVRIEWRYFGRGFTSFDVILNPANSISFFAN